MIMWDVSDINLLIGVEEEVISKYPTIVKPIAQPFSVSLAGMKSNKFRDWASLVAKMKEIREIFSDINLREDGSPFLISGR